MPRLVRIQQAPRRASAVAWVLLAALAGWANAVDPAGAVGPPAQLPCPDGDRVGWLGIDALDCDCTSDRSGDDALPLWRFRSEPRIRSVEARGPAHGKLRSGDVIVAVDGEPITSAAGARHFSRPVAGRPVELAVRRRGAVTRVHIVPQSLCADDPRLSDFESPRPLVAPSPPLAVVPPAPNPARAPRAAPSPTTPTAPTPAPDVPTGFDDLPTRGWLGVGLRCDGCEVERDRRRDVLVWRFESPPTIYSVDSNSPAYRAGVRRGDVLTHVDNLPIDTVAGGERFGSLRPGDRAHWTIQRRGRAVQLDVVAAARPERAGRRTEELRQLLQRLRQRGALELEGDEFDRLRELLGDLEASQPAAPVAPAPPVAVTPVEPLAARRGGHLRYAGTVGDTRVEVRGNGSVVVSEDPRTGRLTIDAGDATIRIQPRSEP
jgi:hypothetical protein